MSYRVWVRSWVLCEEVFDDRDAAERHRLKMTANRPTLGPADVMVVPEAPSSGTLQPIRLPAPVWAAS